MLELQNLPSPVRVFIKEQSDIIERGNRELKTLHAEISYLREALRLARMIRFARKQEKFPSNQLELFNEAEFFGLKAETEVPLPAPVIVVPGHTRARPRRKALPEHLVREEVIIDLAEAEKFCEHDGEALKEIGADISEQLDIIPAKLKVIKTIRKKYACTKCQSMVKTAALPKKILPKSNATPGLLAHIAVSKYVDALPLYRLEQMFKRLAIDIPRNTMAGWMIGLAGELQPVYNLMEEDLLDGNYVCCDETRVQVLKEAGKAPQSQSYMWVRSRHGPAIRPIILFDYDPTRSGEVPKRLLGGFAGYLQVDGYVGYDGVCNNGKIKRVGCMAHIRRKFFEAYKVSGKSGGEANRVLGLIQKLYKIEERIGEEIRDKQLIESHEYRHKIRQEESVPILKEFSDWLEANRDKYPPEGLMGKAVSYGRNQWSHMMRYLEDGQLAIDNNFTENRIRPFAVGRKNWLFADSVAGARASGMIYSILQTARGSGLEPYAYMRHLLTELPNCESVEQIESILPHKINPEILA